MFRTRGISVFKNWSACKSFREKNYSSRRESFQADSFLDIGTREIFKEEHDLFRTNVRKFYRDEVAPQHPKWEKEGQVSREIWERAGELGFLGVDTSVELGGSGGDFLMATVLMEEQAYSNCTGLGYFLHSNIVMPYISKYGSPVQIEKYIPAMTSGKIIGAIAMSEPGAGSDLQGIRTVAKKDGTDYILNGSKTFISNGYMSDVVITVALTDPSAKSAAYGLSLFLVDATTPGFKKGKKLEKIGLKAQDTSELFYEDCRVPASALLGNENQGFFYLMQELPQERLMISIGGQAASEFMFEETRKYVEQRKAFKKTLSKLQTIRHKLSEMKTELAIGRSFVDKSLAMHLEGKLDIPTAAMGKYWISEMQNRVAYQCLQYHGGYGFMLEYPISKAFLDARVQPIYGGSNEIMKELISRSIFND